MSRHFGAVHFLYQSMHNVNNFPRDFQGLTEGDMIVSNIINCMEKFLLRGGIILIFYESYKLDIAKYWVYIFEALK